MKARNILCYSLILASLVSTGVATFITAPSNILAENSTNDDERSSKDASDFMVSEQNMGGDFIAPKESYYSDEELNNLYENFYNNDYYRDGFFKYIKTGLVYDFDVVKIKQPLENAIINYSETDFKCKLNTTIEDINNIHPLRTKDNDIVFNLSNAIDLDESNESIQKTDNISLPIKSILQGYKNRNKLIPNNLDNEEWEYCTSVALYLVQNNIPFSEFTESIIDDNEKYEPILEAINALMNYQFEEKTISIDVSPDVDVRMEDDHYNIYSGENIIHTNFDKVDVKIYDTFGLNGLNISKIDSSENSEEINDERAFSDNDRFLSKLNSIDVEIGIDLIEDYPEKKYLPRPYENSYQIIAGGDDISDASYSNGVNEFYIVQDETKIFLFDYDLHPEKYVNLYQRKNINLSVVDNSTNTIIPNAKIDVYYKMPNSEEYIYLDEMISNDDGIININNANSGEYKFIVSKDNFIQNDCELTVLSDNTDLNYKRTFNQTIYLESVCPNIKIVNNSGYDWSNHKFKITNIDTNETFTCQTDNNAEIKSLNIPTGNYFINVLDGEYEGWNRMFNISDIDNNYIVDFSIDSDTSQYEKESIEDSLNIINKINDDNDEILIQKIDSEEMSQIEFQYENDTNINISNDDNNFRTETTSDSVNIMDTNKYDNNYYDENTSEVSEENFNLYY